MRELSVSILPQNCICIPPEALCLVVEDSFSDRGEDCPSVNFWGLFFIRALVSFRRAPLSWPRHPPSNTTHGELEAYEFWRDIQHITVLHIVSTSESIYRARICSLNCLKFHASVGYPVLFTWRQQCLSQWVCKRSLFSFLYMIM